MHDGTVIEDSLLGKDLKRATKAKDIFQCVNIFFKHNLEIQIICSVCTDGAPVMLGNIFCFG